MKIKRSLITVFKILFSVSVIFFVIVNNSSACYNPPPPPPSYGPILTSPAIRAGCQSVENVRLDWNGVSGATYYYVYLYPKSGPETGGKVATVYGNTYWDTENWSQSPLEYNTTYFWYVKACNSGGGGPFGMRFYFTTEFAGPAQAADPIQDDADGTVVLSWTSEPNATRHNIYLGTDPNELWFVDTQYEPLTSYNAGELEPAVYYWRVDEAVGCRTVTEGQVWSFTIHDVWYVNNAVSGGLHNGTSWENAFVDLQSALDVADPNGDEIWVAKGWEPYYPSKTMDPCDPNSAVFELVSGIAVYGGFDGTEKGRNERDSAKNVTVLSGDRGNLNDPDDDCYHVIKCQDVNNVILDGFTITDGYAFGVSSDINCGGGIHCDQSSVTIRRCIISQNTAESYGGGIYCADSNLVLTNCIISENRAADGGGIYDVNSLLTLTNCTFNGNSANNNGGGIYNDFASSDANLVNCIFWGDDAGGDGNEIYNISSDPNFSYCDIEGCDSSSNWDTNFGADGGYNEDQDPLFTGVMPVKGIVSRWDFDEIDGTTAYDSVGGNDGTVYGDPNWKGGVLGRSLCFDGNDDYVNCGSDSSLDITDDLFVGLWINTTTVSGQHVFVSKYEAASGQRSWLVRQNDAKVEVLLASSPGDSETSIKTTGDVLDANTWHHVVFTYDQACIKIYIDGANEPADNSFSGALNSTSQPVLIGNHVGAAQFFDGFMDEVVIHNRALFGFEVQQVYQRGLAGHNNYHVQSKSPCINAGDPNRNYDGQLDIDSQQRVQAGRVDIGAHEAAWTVYNSDNGAYGAWYEGIQAAIDDANDGHQIIAYPATYYETVDFNGLAVALRSIEPNDCNIVLATIIDGNGVPGAGHVVTFDNGEDTNSVLWGFTITGGYASGSTADAKNGGGIYCNQSSPTIKRCIIRGNTAADNGGGIYDCNSSAPMLINCIFSGNNADCGGGMYNLDCSPNVISCTFHGNYADDYGGGVYDSNSETQIKNSILWGNTAEDFGDQIYKNSSDPNFSYCDIEDCNLGTDSWVWDANLGTDGGGNISYAPYLKLTGNDAYRLLDYSACIDAGDPNSDYSDEPDDAGNTCINIGAFGNTAEAALASADSDSDSMPDTWEKLYWPYYELSYIKATDDTDSDNLNNLQEYRIGLDPTIDDTDDDGMDDGWEHEYGLDPLDSTDIYDDPDGDGLYNLLEYTTGTNPDSNDTDGDEMPDGWEVSHGLDPTDANDATDDDDNDGLTNYQEYWVGTDPTDDDSDNDGMDDKWEIEKGLAPLNSSDATGDLDDDDYTNLSEYLHSSNPNDGNSVPSSNVTITVPDDLSSIQSAIDASIDSDVIEVLTGKYLGAIDFKGKTITVTSTDPNDWDVVLATIIKANTSSQNVVSFDSGEGPNSVLTGLTVTGGQYGVFCSNSSSPMLTRCVIEDNASHGIYIEAAGSATVANNMIGPNRGDGIYVYDVNSTPSISNNIICDNSRGVFFSDANSAATISNNTVVYNYRQGVYVSGGGEPNIINCIFWGNDGSDLDGCSATYSCIEDGDEGTGNISSDPNFINSLYWDFHLSQDSPCINAGDPGGSYAGQMDIDGNTRVQLDRVDIGADERSLVRNINSGLWYSTIQSAIDDASSGHVIELAQGTYCENINFKGVSCILTGTDCDNWNVVANTVIDANDPNASVVTFNSSEGANSIIRGLTITSGNSGIYCNGASPTISSCIITDNNSPDYGGGIYNYNSSPAVTDCFFIENDANFGGGIYNFNSSPAVTNCVFGRNVARIDGGGMYNDDSSPTVINCTFGGNCADANGGAMCSYGSSSQPDVTNCIFWGNDAGDCNDEIHDIYSADPNVTYCDVNGGYTGTGNINTDPNFIDINNPGGSDGVLGTADDGLAVTFYSACIDKGNNAAVPEGITLDIKGSDRIETVVDMGAYEYDGPNVICVVKDAPGNNDGSSWYDAFNYLQDALDRAEAGDEIWVATGVYAPNECSDPPADERSASFQLVEQVALYGGFDGTETVSRDQRNWKKNLTVLSGDIGTMWVYTDNSYNVVRGADNAVLDGFVIRGGNADFPAGSTRYYYCGAGMYNENCSPTVNNCVFVANRALEGAGMYNYRSNVTLSNCVFTDNVANRGGGMYHHGSNPTLVNCIFTHNTAFEFGSAIHSRESKPGLTNCTMMNDQISLYYSEMKLQNCVLWNENTTPLVINPEYKTNTTYVWQMQNTYVFDKIFIVSRGESKPPICKDGEECVWSPTKPCGLWGCVPELYYDKLIREVGHYVCVAIYPMPESCKHLPDDFYFWYYYVPWYEKKIVYVPVTTQYCVYDHSNFDVTYCDIKGGYEGTGNISNEPCFVNGINPRGPDGIFGTLDDGLRLAACSACIDAADGDVSPSVDILGLGRVDIDGVSNTGTGYFNYVDMGAYESYDGIDSDADGMSDDYEIWHNLNPDVNDAESDLDGDGLTNLMEFINSTIPDNNDTDGDGMDDGWEVMGGLDPLVYDANTDTDFDGLTNLEEYQNNTNPIDYDTDGDIMPDKWEVDNNLDPTDPDDADDDSDSDGFINVVEYLFGYDMNETTVEEMNVDSSLLPFVQINPNNDTLVLEYWLNMAGNVEIKLKKTNDNWQQAVRTVNQGWQTAGWHQWEWDCNDGSGNLVERYFYDVNIFADDGGNTANWESADGGDTSYYTRSTGRDLVHLHQFIYKNMPWGMYKFDNYKNIPVKITSDMLDWATRTINVVEDDCISCPIYHVTDDRLLKPGWNTFEWHGRWDNGANDGKMYEDVFDVYFGVPGSVNRGAVLVYYGNLVSNLRCNPYRVRALSDEVAVIMYDLAMDANVTITITDPDGDWFKLVDNEYQQAEENPQAVVLHGTSHPNYSAGIYISKEGVYRIEVEATVGNITEKLDGSVTIYR